jgi:methylmalonyl-CoA epimerase
LDEAASTFERAFGAVSYEVSAPSVGVRIAFVSFDNCLLELFQPLTSEHPTAKILAEHGPGVHHIAVEVATASEALDGLIKAGFRARDTTPRLGAANSLVAWMDPDCFAGTALHIVEPRTL